MLNKTLILKFRNNVKKPLGTVPRFPTFQVANCTKQLKYSATVSHPLNLSLKKDKRIIQLWRVLLIKEVEINVSIRPASLLMVTCVGIRQWITHMLERNNFPHSFYWAMTSYHGRTKAEKTYFIPRRSLKVFSEPSPCRTLELMEASKVAFN